MKRILLTFLFVIITICTFAQTAWKDGGFNVGPEFGIIAGKLSGDYTYSVGGSVKYDYLADNNFYLTISAGYVSIKYTDNYKLLTNQAGFRGSSISYIPLKVGGKTYISSGLFFEAQLGTSFADASLGADAFIFSPGFGYSFNNGLELGARYEGWFQSGILSQYIFRASYRFKL
jgi:hypothetical protein